MSQAAIVRKGSTGRAVVSGTDTGVDEILAELAERGSVDGVLAVLPQLTRDGVEAALRFAAGAVQHEAPYLAPSPSALAVHEPAVGYGVDEDMETTIRHADEEHERLLYELDLLDGIREGLRQVAAGEGIPNDEVFARLRARFDL